MDLNMTGLFTGLHWHWDIMRTTLGTQDERVVQTMDMIITSKDKGVLRGFILNLGHKWVTLRDIW